MDELLGGGERMQIFFVVFHFKLFKCYFLFTTYLNCIHSFQILINLSKFFLLIYTAFTSRSFVDVLKFLSRSFVDFKPRLDV